MPLKTLCSVYKNNAITNFNTTSTQTNSSLLSVNTIISNNMSESVVGDTTTTPPKKRLNWFLVILYSTLTAIGNIGGPLLQRFYYTHGGSSKWLSSLLQSVGFITLIPPLSFLYFKTLSPKKQTPKLVFFIEPKLMLSGAGLGLLSGVVSYFYSAGLSSIPVSTSSLLLSTQLAFTALFARLIVKQKITFYSLNSVMLIILGAVVLALRASNDRPLGETREKYFLGFLFTILGAVSTGLLFPLIELVYSKSSKPMNYLMVFQFQFVMYTFASLFATAGMLISKDYKIISKEAEEFGLGEKKYWLIIVASAVVWQFGSLGAVGIISCTSSLFAGILSSAILPLIEIASVITFGEKFSGEKGMSLALCLWGFTSYFIGEYKKSGEKKPIVQLNDV